MVWRRKWGRLEMLFLVLTAAVLPACVSHSEYEGAPCPCPEGFLCCATLSACVDSSANCPKQYPASSAAPCKQDAECPINEICWSWTNDGGGVAGPRQCRRACTGAFPCAEGEACDLVPHDSKALGSVAVLRACVPKKPVDGCQGVGCRDCTDKQIGKAFCNGTSITGCFITLDSKCGLTCELITLQDCDPGQCEITTSVARCKDVYVPDLCTKYPCSDCADAVVPGNKKCVGDRVLGCASISYSGKTCEQICHPFSKPCPSGWTCTEKDGAYCAP